MYNSRNKSGDKPHTTTILKNVKKTEWNAPSKALQQQQKLWSIYSNTHQVFEGTLYLKQKLLINLAQNNSEF